MAVAVELPGLGLGLGLGVKVGVRLPVLSCGMGPVASYGDVVGENARVLYRG